MASQAAGVDIATLQPEQLRQLGDLLNEELGVLGKHLQSLQGAVERFHRSGLAVEALGRAAEGTPALLPLTQSLYAPGTLGSTDKVLIDVGTGYFVEYTPVDGVDYCRRKVGVLKENLDKLGEIMQEKRRQLFRVKTVLDRKTGGKG